MQLDFSKVLTDLENNPVVDEFGKVAELPKIIGKALWADAQSAEEKLQKFELYLKLKLSGYKADITAEEAALLKKAVSIYSTGIYGQLVHWIEGRL